MSESLEFALSAVNDRFHDDDPRWLGQVAALVRDLRPEADAVRLRRTPVPGTKGAADQLIISLASTGAFGVVLQMLKAWLARDKDRAIEVTFTDARGKTQTIRVSAENAETGTLKPLIATAESLAKGRT